MRGKKLTYDEFLLKAKLKHGNKYDYSLSCIDDGTAAKIKIICNKCGNIFEQRVRNHLHGQGCPECAKEERKNKLYKANDKKKKTAEENILDFNAIYGDRYDYSRWDVCGTSKKGIIICHEKDEFGNEHGEFPMSANSHKAGHGCPSCAGNKKINKEIFIRDAKLKYGNKHDYSLINEVNNVRTKIKIKCNVCGNIFEQRVSNYLNGKGCPKCALLARCNREDFIKKAKLKHGDNYDYSLVHNIKNRKTKVKIKCNICGIIFEQKVNNHLNGQGCPKCNESHLERDVRIKLYKNNINFETQKTFPWLKNKREMSLDFYLTDYNIAIECQGVQHHKAHGFFYRREG